MRPCHIPALVAVVALALIGCRCQAESIIFDSFEPVIAQPPWSKIPGSGEIMWCDTRNSYTGTHCALAQPNWRYSYTMMRALLQAYAQDVYVSIWVYDPCEISPGFPSPPDNPYYWSEEHVPHALLRLEDSAGFEFLHLGPIGKNKKATDPQWPDNIYFSVNTAYEGRRILSGPPTCPVPVRREPGWRLWMIRLKPYSGAKGDVEFYVDSQLVYQGYRATGPFGPATVDTIGAGSLVWTAEWYWYDDVTFDYWPSPTTVGTIQEALSYPDGTWVQIGGLTVDSAHPESITVADSQSALIDIYPARFEAPGDVVNVLGWLETSDAGRYIRSHVVDRVSVAPTVVLTHLSEVRDLPNGTRVRTPSRVVTASLAAHRFIQEQDRTFGLKVRNIYEPAIGDKVTIDGQIMRVGPETLLEAEKVAINSRGNPLPKAVGVPNRFLYTPSVIPSGMLIVTTGRVVYRPEAQFPGWVEIRDGSMPPDAFPVRVQIPSSTVCPNVGDYIWVKGAAGWLVESVGSRPRVYCCNLSDLRVLH